MAECIDYEARYQKRLLELNQAEAELAEAERLVREPDEERLNPTLLTRLAAARDGLAVATNNLNLAEARADK
jgi:hypothetical protein